MSGPVPLPLSIVALDLAAAFADAPLPPEAAEVLAGLDDSGLVIHGYRIVETSHGRVIQLRMPPGRVPQARLAVPGLTAMDLLLSLNDDVVVEVTEPGPHMPYAEVGGLRLAVRFDPALLRPVDGTARAELSWTGALRWYHDGHVALAGDPELRLTPCEIGRTGIVVELEGVQLDLATDRSPASIRALGLDPSFQGMYARSGSVRLLPQTRFGNRDGLRVDVRDFAVGTSGVTGSIGRFYTLEPTPEGRLDPATALVGELYDGAWQLGIGTVAVELRQSAVTAFRIDGIIRLPLFDALLGVGFGMRAVGPAYETTIRVGSLQPVVVGLGTGSLRLARFALEGVLGVSDALAISGSVDSLELDLAPLRVTADRMGVSVAHSPDVDELRAELRDVSFGPLGTLDVAELVVRERRNGTTVGREISVEAILTWEDLRDRIDLPAGLQGPSSGQARAALRWEDNNSGGQRLVVRVAAVLDDLTGLWEFLPNKYRPQIEEASLEFEIVYENTAAFDAASTTAPLSGSINVSVAVHLPMLAELPGLNIHGGDQDDLVRGTLKATVQNGNTQVALHLANPLSLDLTLPGTDQAVELRLDAVTIVNGDSPGEGRFALAGSASAPAMDGYFPGLMAKLGLPPEMSGLLEPLGQAMPEEASFSLAVLLDGVTEKATVDLAFISNDPLTFSLLDAVGHLVNPSGVGPQGASEVPGLDASDEFFEVSPRELRLTTTLAETPLVLLSGTLDAMVFGETFDMTAEIRVEPDDFEIRFAAGSTDPILITVPLPDQKALLGAADLSGIAATYALERDQSRAVEQVDQFLADLVAELGSQGVFAFEISNFGVGVTPKGPNVSGTAQLVQLPRVVEQLMPLSQLSLGLGVGVDKIFVTIERTEGGDQEPLLTVPVPGGVDVDVRFNGFMLAYAWGRNVFAFALDAGIEPSKTIDVTVGGSGVFFPGVISDVELGATASAPPAPMPQGILSFRRPEGDQENWGAVDDLGLQAVIGTDDERWVTAYLRELAFSPTYFLLWPGFRGDGGLVLGGPNPKDMDTADEYFEVRAWDRGKFFARFTVQGGSLIFVPALFGVMMNPLAVVPPFVTANPPYWIVPPLIMGDLYADKIGVSVNLPGLVFFDMTFERPLPSFSLQSLLELTALAAGGFMHPIPEHSPLRRMLYTRLSVSLEVGLLGLGQATSGTPPIVVEVNVADFINGAIGIMHKTKATLKAGSDASQAGLSLIQDVTRDPTALVRMIPPEARKLEQTITMAGFLFTGSLYLLAPDELQDELALFFDNKRRIPRGIAANVPPPPVPVAEPINQAAAWTATIPISHQRPVNVQQIPPDMTTIANPAIVAALGMSKARATQVENLINDRNHKNDTAAEAIANRLAQIESNDTRAYTKILRDAELEDLASPLADAVSRLMQKGRPINKKVLIKVTKSIIAKGLARHDKVILSDVALQESPETLAATLVGKVIKGFPGSRAGVSTMRASSRPPFMLDSSARVVEIDNLMPGGQSFTARNAVNSVFASLESKLTDVVITDVAARRAITNAELQITEVLTQQFNVQYLKVGELQTQSVDFRNLAKSIRTNALTTWKETPHYEKVEVQVGTFNGSFYADLLGSPGFLVSQPVDPVDPLDTVEAVVGYQIQRRDGSEVTVSVSSAEALYKVVPDGNQYVLLVRQRDRTWSKHALPDQFVTSVPESPQKADQLRDQLLVVPKIVKRPRTQAEMDAVKDRYEQSETLYLTSILARPEYKVKATGGVHGPFYLADLLRKPTTGKYTVPAGPTLLGGFKTKLFGNSIHLAGLVSGEQSNTNVFLYGHNIIQGKAGTLSFKAEGEFVASSGSWQSIPLPAGLKKAQNAIGFNGHVAITNGENKIVEGRASGEFTQHNEEVSASLDLQVSSQGSVDFDVLGEEFARLSWKLAGNLHVDLTPKTLKVTTSINAQVTAYLRTYRTKWKVITPEQRMCVDWYDFENGRWQKSCATIPAIRRPEVDFNTPGWTQIANGTCALEFDEKSIQSPFNLNLGTKEFKDVVKKIGVNKLRLPRLD